MQRVCPSFLRKPIITERRLAHPQVMQRSHRFDRNFKSKWLSIFEAIESNILEEIVQHLKSSTCYLDTLPTSFFKSVLNCLEADLLEVVNTSLLSGTFPNSLKTSQVTYVTLVPRGNETLRRDAMGNAISVVQLWIICVISQNWRPDVRCGDVMTWMLKSTWCAAGASFQEWSIALVGMPEVWPCDAASRSLGEPGLHT